MTQPYRVLGIALILSAQVFTQQGFSTPPSLTALA